MIENLLKIPVLSRKSKINFNKKGLKEVIQKYSFIHISENEELKEEDKQHIFHQIKESKVVIFSRNEKLNQQYVLVGFENMIIILALSSNSKKLLQDLLSSNPNLLLCFFQDKETLFQEEIDFQHQEIKIDQIFEDEIKTFVNSITTTDNIKQAWSMVFPNIACYLLKKSYLQLEKYRIRRFIHDIENNFTPETIKESEYIELRDIGHGSIFNSVLIYHIKRGELYVIKKPIALDIELEKLNKREISNYEKIGHPFLPKFYGVVENRKYIVIEYIEGNTLSNIKKLCLTLEDKLTIIFELMLIFKYFHDRGMLYRDLKPNNVMIDQNKRAILIDFDRLIENNDDEQTMDINDLFFFAPEVNYTRKYSFKSDIYSLGQMIKFLINETESEKQPTFHSNEQEYAKIYKIIDQCVTRTVEKRPSISEMILNFCLEFPIEIQLDGSISTYKNHFSYFKKINYVFHNYKLNQNDPKAQYNLGAIYLKGEYVMEDINKAIYYFSLAANQNYPKAQYNLGIFYYDGKYVTRNINKTIHYYSLAANQNNKEAQNNLGAIYYEGKYVTRDINKAIHYLSLAANQNDPTAQYNLGAIYFEDKYVTRDINKAIHYFLLAAKQNHPKAQFCLGSIYSKSEYVARDINKAIHYFSLAANQNDPQAQFNLGFIYYEGKHVTRDVYKAIHYFSLAANQNVPIAQVNLGFIYEEGKYVTRDINKAIHYYSLAANQNLSSAQYILGAIYHDGKYVARDINKAIHYYSLAANQNLSQAQFFLGFIYYEGKYVTRDMNKAIHYFSLAANQNYPFAQFNLGIIFYFDKNNHQNIRKGCYYIMLASKNGKKEANFMHGFLLHEGKNIKRNIEEAVHFYKEASSFNNQYAKNNLGIIYKHGLEGINKYLGKSIEYFEEAIRQTNDHIAMYNLAHLFIYEENIKKEISKSIELLIKSSNQFTPSLMLLSLLIIQTYGFDIERIIAEIESRTDKHTDLSARVIQNICDYELFDINVFQYIYEKYRKMDYLYDARLQAIISSTLQDINIYGNIPKYPKAKNISNIFYKGFGHDLIQKID